MTLKQLRYLCAIYEHGLHLSHAANALHTSQSGISKQVQMLEQELGIVIFNRRRNRILSLTQPGQDILRFAKYALTEIDNIRSLSREYSDGHSGDFAIATTHTQASYGLPAIVRRFVKRYPNVHLEFWQDNRQAVFERVDAGYADIALGSGPDVPLPNVVMIPCGSYCRSVITPPKHPLLKTPKLTLEEIAKYPIIIYASRSSGQWKLGETFEKNGVKANIVFRAVDTDTCKTYVRLGIGIAIMPDVTYDRAVDRDLRAISVKHLFTPEPLYIGLNKRDFHRQYLFDFIEMICPSLTRDKVQQHLNASAQAPNESLD